jgi:hypothetical protein
MRSYRVGVVVVAVAVAVVVVVGGVGVGVGRPRKLGMIDGKEVFYNNNDKSKIPHRPSTNNTSASRYE